MPRTYGSEMTLVKRDHQIGTETFGQSHDRRIRTTQREVRVLLDEIADSLPIIRVRSLHIKTCETSQEGRFCVSSQALAE